MQIIKTIDLWNDHKKSQSLDPFIVDYFNEETETFSYDTVLFCPNLIGRYKIIGPDIIGELDATYCPQFNGGLIFLKNNKPIRLYFCQINDIVEKSLGHKYGLSDILEALNSNELIGKTEKTLKQLLKQNNVKIIEDKSAISEYTSPNFHGGNDVVLESADCMGVLTSPTFLQKEEDWEAITFNPDLEFDVVVNSKDFNFKISINHKGYIVGVKRNVGGLVEQVNGKKLYGIVLQVGNQEEYDKMIKYTQEFAKNVGDVVSKDTLQLGSKIDQALLDK